MLLGLPRRLDPALARAQVNKPFRLRAYHAVPPLPPSLEIQDFGRRRRELERLFSVGRCSKYFGVKIPYLLGER